MPATYTIWNDVPWGATTTPYTVEGTATVYFEGYGDSKGVVDMGLNMPPSEVKTGINYGQHLGSVTYKPITASTSFEKKGSPAVDAKSETIHPGVATKGMSIAVEGGRTINLGNYESARIGITITVPCEMDTLTEAYDFATQWISEKIEEAVKAAKG